MTGFKQPVSVLVVVHSPNLDVLLLERAGTGLWQSVTGSREGEETLVETARREVFEETGIQAELAQFCDWRYSEQFEIFKRWRQRYAPGVRYNTEHIFSLSVPANTPITLSDSEHQNCQWQSWRVAAEMVFSWTNRNAILRLPGRIRQHSSQIQPGHMRII